MRQRKHQPRPQELQRAEEVIADKAVSPATKEVLTILGQYIELSFNTLQHSVQEPPAGPTTVISSCLSRKTVLLQSLVVSEVLAYDELAVAGVVLDEAVTVIAAPV